MQVSPMPTIVAMPERTTADRAKFKHFGYTSHYFSSLISRLISSFSNQEISVGAIIIP
jgi:hypothetical protein